MVNHRIDLPSKRAVLRMTVGGKTRDISAEELYFDPSIIERPLRRKFRTRKTHYIALLYLFLFLGTIVCTILHFFVEPHIISEAHAAEPGTLEYFCQTGIANGEIDPKALSANTRELCD